jgi:ABC-type glutathione transport system ATPase component
MRAPKFSPLPVDPDEYERLGDDGRAALGERRRDVAGFHGPNGIRHEQPLLVASGLSKRFGQVEALVDVDLELRAGEVVALVGDNGAGKSTFIKAISGVQPADAGATSIDGKRVKLRNAKTPTSAVSRPSTRTSPSATTSTLSRTSSWAGRS